MKKSKKRLPSRVKVGNQYVGEGEPVFFIAEIGNNHNGDYYLAKRSIEEAVRAGADAVKFQKRFVDDMLAKELSEKPQTKDQVYGKTYGEYRKKLELDLESFIKLKKLADKLGVIFFATPFDKKSADFLAEVDVDAYKIASFDVTNLPLLEYVAQKNRPMFLSVGMSTWSEIDEAVATILKYNQQLIILHCVTIYPAPDDRLNLSTIQYLKEQYKPLPTGYSGHENDILPALAAIALGAKTIEKHFTLDKLLPGPDHATVSIEPQEFRQLVDSARRIEKILGAPKDELWEEERKTRDKHGKSIVSAVAIPAGTVITEKMIAYKCPGYGIKPGLKKLVIGKKARVAIPEDVVIKPEFLKSKR
jgi:sialic acid synthase SpsE